MSLQPFLELAGRWTGSNRLHDPHTGKPEDSPSRLVIAPLLGGKFIRLDYTWNHQGKPHEGSLLVGFNSQTSELSGHWIDSWHMAPTAMILRGSMVDGGELSLLGSYAAPPGPDWGWRIDIELRNLDDRPAIELRMTNINPDGKTEPAVEATWKRETNLSEIGQIALVASDVSKLVPFYRDVLGLEFLFSPSPQLAFLKAGDVRLMLTTPQGAGKVGENSVLYFKVPNVEAVFQTLLDRGANSERPPQLVAKMPDHELWIGFLRDPDGNLIGLMEERR